MAVKKSFNPAHLGAELPPTEPSQQWALITIDRGPHLHEEPFCASSTCNFLPFMIKCVRVGNNRGKTMLQTMLPSGLCGEYLVRTDATSHIIMQMMTTGAKTKQTTFTCGSCAARQKQNQRLVLNAREPHSIKPVLSERKWPYGSCYAEPTGCTHITAHLVHVWRLFQRHSGPRSQVQMLCVM